VPHFQQEQQDAATRYRLAVQTKQASHLALNEINEIVPAASLFLARNRQQWGSFDPATQTVTLHQSMEMGDEDLFDFAALEILLHNGTVYVGEPEQVPDQSQIAALLRY
jgi:predicted metal-dependent hydrolase